MRGLFDALMRGMEIKSDARVLSELPSFLSWGGPTKSGQSVNWQTALKATAVLASCRVLCNGVAQVPWKVMRQRSGGGADPAKDHPLYRLLNRKPSKNQTSFEFRQTLVLHLVLTGNAYVFKSLGPSDRILELIPLEPGRVSVTEDRGELTYSVSGTDGRVVKLTDREIWHTRAMAWNGWIGLEPVRLAAEAIGLSLALEESHARQHANGVQPSGTYTVDGELTAEQHTQLTEWIKKHASGDNRGAPLILDRGAKWLAQQMSGVDAQHIETRRFQVEDTARAMGVMPIMIGAGDKAQTYASAEQNFAAHVVHAIQPICENIEQSADVRLLGVEDDTGFYTHLDLRGLQRGTLKDQADYFSKALGSGGSPAWLTQDEVRDELDRNPMGGSAARLREPTNVGKITAPPKEEEA